MPSLSLTLPDVEESVARPIVFDVVRQIFEITQLSTDTEILFAGKRGTLTTPGTTIDDHPDKARDPRFKANRYTYLEVNEDYDRQAYQETSVHAFDQRTIYQDNEIRASARPVYLTSDVEIRVRYQSTSETEVRRWMANQYAKHARGREYSLVGIDYTYTLPDAFVRFLTDLWRLREAVSGYGDTLTQYIEKKSTNQLTLLGDRAGESLIYAIKQHQFRINGQFDFVGIPDKPEWNEDTGTWTLSFGFKFSYQRPDLLFLHYPISVHNQFMPDHWLSYLGNEVNGLPINRSYNQTYDALSQFEGDAVAEEIRRPQPYLRIPSFDDVRLAEILPGSATVFTALCFLEDDRQVLLDLNDLGDYLIDQDILEYLQAEAPYLTKAFQSFFYVSLYRHDRPVDASLLEVTDALVVKSTIPLNARLQFRVRLSLQTEIGMILPTAQARLANYPKAFVKIVGAINELIRDNPDFKYLGSKARIEPWEYESVFQIISGGIRLNNATTRDAREFIPGAGPGQWTHQPISRWLSHLDPRVVEDYIRRKRRPMLTTMVAGILASAA